MEKSSIEKLTAFAKKNNFKYWNNSNYQRNYLTPGDSFLNTKFFAMEYESGGHKYYYCAFDSFAAKAYSATIYSGIFRDFSYNETPDLKMQAKFWIDNFIFQKRVKMDSAELNKKLIINSSNNDFAKQIISSKVGSAFTKLSKLISPIDFIIDSNFLKYNPGLKGKSIIGIKTNKWIIEESELNLVLNKGTNLLELIKNRG